MKIKRKTKIIATLGPACNDLETIKKLITAGVNVFRLNFSHGSHQEHYENISKIRQASEDLKCYVGVLQDLSGPKIRITELKKDCKALNRSEKITLKHSDENSDHKTICTSAINPTQILNPGDNVLLADGVIVLEVDEVTSDKVICKIIKGGNLRSKIGIAFPDSEINLPATTEKDMQDLAWGLEHKVDFVAISFVQKASDVERVSQKLTNLSNVDKPHIIAKIEMKAALNNLQEILDISDGIMIARGDLGVELPVEKLPIIQKDLIAKANALGKPVIVATQMLHSMVNANRPTRAEVTDVAVAVTSGTDAVMLSEETAIGSYPVESVEYLAKIAKEAEIDFNFEVYKLRFNATEFKDPVPDAVAYAACAAAHRLDAAAISACTETGHSAKLIAKYRPQQALYGVSSRAPSLRRMSLFWGVTPIMFDAPESRGKEIEDALATIQDIEKLEDNDIAVITGGLTVRTPGTTSVLEIRTFGQK